MESNDVLTYFTEAEIMEFTSSLSLERQKKLYAEAVKRNEAEKAELEAIASTSDDDDDDAMSALSREASDLVMDTYVTLVSIELMKKRLADHNICNPQMFDPEATLDDFLRWLIELYEKTRKEKEQTLSVASPDENPAATEVIEEFVDAEDEEEDYEM